MTDQFFRHLQRKHAEGRVRRHGVVVQEMFEVPEGLGPDDPQHPNESPEAFLARTAGPQIDVEPPKPKTPQYPKVHGETPEEFFARIASEHHLRGCDD